MKEGTPTQKSKPAKRRSYIVPGPVVIQGFRQG